MEKEMNIESVKEIRYEIDRSVVSYEVTEVGGNVIKGIPYATGNRHYTEVKEWIDAGGVPTCDQDDAYWFNQTKEAHKRQIRMEHSAAIRSLLGGEELLEGEDTSWRKQEEEARAYLADNLTPIPMVSAMKAKRGVVGETETTLCQTIVAKADAYTAAFGDLLGVSQGRLKAVDALVLTDFGTLAEAEAAVKAV